MRLPEEDRELSPHTGFTREHWVAAADGLLAAAWRWASPRGARLDLPGRPSRSGVHSDGLEGYARTFLAAGFRIAGSGGADPLGLVERYAEGLAAGTATPGAEDAESWPLILDYTVQGQPMVESASVALGLRLTRPWLWDRLAEDVRDRAAEWLRGAIRHIPSPNNWYLFPYTVAGFLESVGRGDELTRRVRERALELLETWYRGDGWYADGDGGAFDHYNGWALHLYPVLDAHLAGDVSPLGPRLAEHLAGFGLMFDGNGAPLHLGRSLTYRFAAASAVGLGAVTGDTPLAPGVSRRLLSGALRYFLDRGALTGDGLLSLGWHGPHAATLQPYSGPASPYWAAKAFACLLAGPDHPLWTEVEGAAPSETPTVRAVRGPGFLVQTSGDGLVRVHNHGSDHLRPHEPENAADADPHYGRLAYSTRSGPTSRANVEDNHVALVIGGQSSARRRIHQAGVGQGEGWAWAASWHRPVFGRGLGALPALRVESLTVVRGDWELRVHRVRYAPAGTGIWETGWAAEESRLVPLHGWTGSEEVAAPEGTAFLPFARVPRVTGEVSGTGLFAAAVCLGGTAEAAPSVTGQDGGLRIRWADGFVVAAGFDPVEVRPVS
ncbi:hypothetical protein JOF53_000597 [Crossiella equi]|uniref:DUF2264 domain-containing protein n=1 Tax=Crossiella equi TaxID=130796 RepID=A0ABS5A561_9PSEU|nr:DUF2264 domain-containing protein [Crossiella equi]MBP2471725.1 hypothetical protein [Crossiella equi]